MKSLRHFFRRGDNGDNGPDSDRTSRRNRKPCASNKKLNNVNNKLSNPAPAPAQTRPPPKRKKFLGIF